MKFIKKLLLLSLTVLLFSCGDNDDNSNQSFRSIYSNTFWRGDGGVITFSNDKLFSVNDEEGCYYFKEGSYDNVDYDGCIYDRVTYSIIEETNDKLVFIQVVSDGTLNGQSSPCNGDETIISFEVLTDDLIRITIEYEGDTETVTLVNENSSFSTSGCIDGPLNEALL